MLTTVFTVVVTVCYSLQRTTSSYPSLIFHFSFSRERAEQSRVAYTVYRILYRATEDTSSFSLLSRSKKRSHLNRGLFYLS